MNFRGEWGPRNIHSSSIYNKTDGDRRPGRSFTYNRNSTGPKTVLWGTPPSTVSQLDNFEFVHTRCWYQTRNLCIHLCTLPQTPILLNLDNSRLWGTLWKVILISIQAKSIDNLRSLEAHQLSQPTIKFMRHEQPVLKACRFSEMIRFLLRHLSNPFWIIFFKIPTTTLVRLAGW